MGKKDAQVYYIYSLVDPRDNSHFYVGKTYTLKLRTYSHRCGTGVNKDKNDRIKAIKDAGLDFSVVVHYEVKNEGRDMCLFEIATYIEQNVIQQLLNDKQPLTNMYISKSCIDVHHDTFNKIFKRVGHESADYIRKVLDFYDKNHQIIQAGWAVDVKTIN